MKRITVIGDERSRREALRFRVNSSQLTTPH